MSISENFRDLWKYKFWQSHMARWAWRWVIGGFSFVIVLGGVMILGSEVVGRGSASTGALITVTLVAITAGVIAVYGLDALRDRLPPATYQRVGLVAFWVAVLTIVGFFLALAFR